MKIKLDTHNWNPIVFAAFFRQVSVLEFFHDTFGHRFDIVWALSASPLEFSGYDGIMFKHIKPSERAGTVSFQDQIGKDQRLKTVFEECSHLRGHVLAILTKNVGLI